MPYVITDAARIETSLTGRPGDPRRGRAAWDRAGCGGCHETGGEGEESDAPPLAGLGAGMEPGAIRLWVVAPEVIRPGTAMPSAYAAGQRREAQDPLYGGPRLTASEVEDLVAWLARP